LPADKSDCIAIEHRSGYALASSSDADQNGAGSSTVGPDMNKPMNPTEYLTRDGLHALIRDPRSVRSWPGLLMPGFAADQMSDRQIDLVIDYLAHMAARRTSQ
jgi:hypothetical protein